MKKNKTFFSIILLILLIAIPLKVIALSEEEITAPSAILMETKTGKILYEKNSHEKRPCASITKIMTLLLVMEALDLGKISLSDIVTCSSHAESMGGSDIWLKEGENMNVDDLIKATAVASANDAAVALAEYIEGSESDFVDKMNKKAQFLNMNDTFFKNCNGLDEEGHFSSTYDIALMSKELVKHKNIFNYTSIWIDNLREGKTQIVNTNKLLKNYKGITGLKTGTTSQAGSCISATAQRDNLELVAVILGAKTTKERFSEASKILDYGFANFTMTTPVLPENFYNSELKISNGMNPIVNTQIKISEDFLIPKGREKDIKNNITLQEEIKAPVYKNQKLGTLKFTLDEEIISEYSIVATSDINKISFNSIFKLLLTQATKI